MTSNQNDIVFLTTKEVQNIFKISRVTEIAWRRKGILPRPVVLGRRVYYRKDDINYIQTGKKFDSRT